MGLGEECWEILIFSLDVEMLENSVSYSNQTWVNSVTHTGNTKVLLIKSELKVGWK